MKFMAWLWWTPILSVLALPIALRQAYGRPVLAGDHGALQNRDDRTLFQHPETGRILLAGETNRARTIYTLVSLFCAIVLALLLGKYGHVFRALTQ
ncbi:hypothetical protein BS50DRAFT_44310 [Corynespora cassiicola Philippines]|uniref:Uncharacterized protein n=1 Tax=Corynespora cassiicola Philippines TaxID=1448308 RepID=A0A2T2PD88_CORCC|nr:hypothetical protein BS50DRAFT_44310 [Corynespora cassiicola Philippines]